jgi:hypothetical protein
MQESTETTSEAAPLAETSAPPLAALPTETFTYTPAFTETATLTSLFTPTPIPPARAQDDQATVPDVTGLSISAAAALLNRNGMALGLQTEEPWNESLGQPGSTIIAQSLAPADRRAHRPDARFALTNMLLAYTCASLPDQPVHGLEPERIGVQSLDSNTAPRSANWMAALDGGGQCAQLWAELRNGPEKPAECTGVERWWSTVNTSAHFWTGSNGVTRFSVVYEGVERTVCEGAAQGQGQQKECTFFLPAGTAGGDTTGYVYLAYTTDRLNVHNQSGDKWMPLAQTFVYNYNPNVSVRGAHLINKIRTVDNPTS